MKLIIKKGATSQVVHIFIQDSSSATGAGLTGLTSGSTGLVCYRARQDDGNAGATQLALSAGTRGTWSSGGFVEKDATNMPGLYELGLDNAGIASGVDRVVYMLKGTTNMAPLAFEVELVAFDPQDATRMGLTALPNAAANGVGGVPVLDANSLVDVDVKRWLATAVAAATAGIPDVNAKNINNVVAPTLTGDAFARLGAPAGASVSADVAAVKSDTGTILADVNTGAGAIYTRIGAPAGASIAADIAAVNAKTTNLPASPAAVGSAMTLTTGERTSVADALLDRDMSLGTDSGSPSVRTVRQALRWLRNKWTISGTAMTIFKEDDATSSWTSVVTATPGANPITTNDPA